MGSLPIPATLSYLPWGPSWTSKQWVGQCGLTISPGSAGSMLKVPWLRQERLHLQASLVAAVYTTQSLTLSCFDLDLITVSWYLITWLPGLPLSMASATVLLSQVLIYLLWSSQSQLPDIHWPDLMQFTNTNKRFKDKASSCPQEFRASSSLTSCKSFYKQSWFLSHLAPLSGWVI